MIKEEAWLALGDDTWGPYAEHDAAAVAEMWSKGIFFFATKQEIEGKQIEDPARNS